MIKEVLITGGAGYVGCVLVPQLLERGYRVKVFDKLFFGTSGLPTSHENLRVIEGDIRETSHLAEALLGVDAVLHLACISNDPSFYLNENLSKTINFDCFEPMVIAAKKAGVRRFVYCSSSSVYGVSEVQNVTEDHPLVPLTLYSKYKGMCEPLLFRHQDRNFSCVTIRPATVCGYSPRTRLDLSVNILTNHAVNSGQINVFGGDQLRPNLHINDMVDLYQLLLEAPSEKISGQTFNVGYENYSIAEIAKMVKSVVQEEFPNRDAVNIVKTSSDDKRSYHINSDKIYEVLGFRAKRSVQDAVRSLCSAFKDQLLPDSMTDSRYFNVKTMQELNVK